MILYKKAQEGAPLSKDLLKAKEYSLTPKQEVPMSFKMPTKKTADNPEFAAMSKVLNQRNKHNPWVKRKLENSPLKIDNADGSVSSHKLMTSTGDRGETYVYPSIVEINGKLQELSPDRAWGHAVVNKTAIRFDDAKFADYYAKNGLIKH